jgi:glycosyltransferase involved in cell wall biosynthesis
MQRVLWLASWYPSRVSPFNGDFIQRHAHAVGAYCRIDVLHVIGDPGLLVPVEVQAARPFPNVSEQIIYYRVAPKPSLVQKIRSNLRYYALFRKAIKDYIAQQGKPDCVHVQVSMKAGLMALWLKKKYGIPYVVTEHWGIYNTIVEDHFATRNHFFRTAVKKVIAGADAFLPVSHYLGKGVNEMVVQKAYSVIPNVADTSLFYHKPSVRSKFRFIHVSNMVPLKNVAGILRAAAALSWQRTDFELWMIGGEGDNAEWKALADSLGLMANGQVHFTGEVPYPAVAAAMQQSDALILFSNIENMPCVIAEALCCGLPVIATRVGGIPEMVNDINGILIEPGAEGVLAGAMGEMMERIEQFDRKAIAGHAAAKYSYEVIGTAFKEIYNLHK